MSTDCKSIILSPLTRKRVEDVSLIGGQWFPPRRNSIGVGSKRHRIKKNVFPQTSATPL